MKKKRLWTTTILLLFTLFFAAPGGAHLISVEGQALQRFPWFAPEEEDFSFETPFMVTRSVQSQTGEDFYIGPQESQAVFAFLSWADADVYQVVVRREDFQLSANQQPAPLILSASALPPACRQTRNNYPYTALLYPLAPGAVAPTIDVELPFDVPEGYGIVIAENPRLGKKEQRPIFDIDSADPELELGVSWFLPLGLTQECLLSTPWLCNFENTLSQPVFFPGIYYIVIWDPEGKPQDYTANIGFAEAASSVIDQTDMQDLVKDNALLHWPCSEPYPPADTCSK